MTALRARRYCGGLIGSSTIVLAIMLASPASAQTTSSVEGHVDGAAAGSLVTLTDTSTGHRDTATIDANGHYSIVGLRPSTYKIESGGKSQTVVVPLGQAVTVDLASTPSASTGGTDIVVVGARTKDVRTTAVTTNVSRFQLENLPNGDRNFLNFAALAPGVTVSPPTLNGNARQVQAGAIASDNTNTFIDGISIKNLVNHGGTIGQNISSGNPFPASAVDQFDVQTQNFKAEFEQAGSAVISTVTKTGGNRFHGELFGEYQPKSFISENYDDRPGHLNNATAPYKPKPNFNNKYYGGNLGGPIIKEKLTFFVDFEGTKKTFGSSDVNVYGGPLGPTATSAAQAYALSARSQYNGSFPATFNEKLYFGKLTFFATPADTINVSAFIRREANLQINGGVTTVDAATNNRNDEHRYQLSWAHRGTNFLNELTVARDAAANGTISNVSGPSYAVTYGTGFGTQAILLGGANFEQDDHQYQTLMKDNVTFYGGPHTLKAGVKVNFTKLQRLENNNGNGTYFFDANSFSGVGSSTPYAARINTADVRPVTAKNTEVGLFIQDDWKPDDHWQVNAGLRWDYESNARNEKFVTPTAVAAALRAYPGWATGGAFNPNDYISTGSNRKPFLGAFQPRLGVSYDVKGDRDLVLTVGAGRYYDRSLFINSALETIKDKYESIATLFPADCGGTLPTSVDALRACGISHGGEVFLLNNKTKIPFSDEFDAAVKKRFGKVNTSITVSYIKSHNIFQYVVGNRLPNGTYSPGGDPIFVYNGVPYAAGIFYGGSAIFDAPLPGFGNIFIGSSDGKASYAAVYLQADKPYTEQSGWGFSTALTLSNARSNDPANFGDPFDFEAPTVGQQGYGNVSGLARWRFVGTGTVKLPFGVKASTVVTLSAGPSYGGVVCGAPSTTPGNAYCYLTNFGIYRPKGIAYKNVDFNITKTFKMPYSRGHELTVYFQALNAFDSVNRNYSRWSGGFQTVGSPGPSLQHDTTGVASQGRSFKVGARYSF
jgi:outer membrane receptor protein involved in Fe transport